MPKFSESLLSRRSGDRVFRSLKMRYLLFFLPVMLLVAGVLTLILAGFAGKSLEQQYRQQLNQQFASHSEHLRMIILGNREGELENYLRVTAERFEAGKIELFDNNELPIASFTSEVANSGNYIEHELPLTIQVGQYRSEEWKLRMTIRPNPFGGMVDSFLIYQLLIMVIIVIGSVAGTFLAFDNMISGPFENLKTAITGLIEGRNETLVDFFSPDELGDIFALFNHFVKIRQTESDRLLEFVQLAGITCFRLDLENDRFDFTGNIADTIGISNCVINTIGDLHSFVHPDQRGSIRQDWYDLKEKIMRDDAGRFETDLKLFTSQDEFSGQADEKWVKLIFGWKRSDTGKEVSGVFVNITNARRQELALRETADRFRKIYENSPVGIWRCQGDRYVYMNQTMAECLGYSSPEEATEKIKSISRDVFFSPVDRTFFMDELKKRDQVNNLELKFKKADGRIFWVAAFGRLFQDRNIQYCEGGLVDITERKLLDEQLRSNEEFLRTGLEAAGVVLWQLEPVSGHMHLKGAVDSLLGHNISELITLKAFQKLIHPDDFGKFINAIDKFRRPENAGPGEKNRVEFRICRVDGNHKVEIRWLIGVGGVSDVVSSGRSGLIRGIFVDITQHKESEEKLFAMVNTTRGESLGKSEFFASISHEVKTPLNAIIGFSELLVPMVEGQKGKHYLSSILAASRSLINTINSILDLSRLESGKIEIVLEPTRITEVIADVHQSMQGEAEKKGIEFSAGVDEGVPGVLMLDEFRIRQIISNLLNNAFRYTTSGSIELRVNSNLTSDRKFIDLTITVEDTGIGMHVDDLKDLFKPFSQKKGQKNALGGAGLGLAICYRLVELMGGRIKVKSELQCGSRFDVLLRSVQIADSGLALAAPRSKERQTYQFKGQKILIADDTASNRELMSEAMRSAGLQVICAADGEEAVQMAMAERPELIFMDIKMPRKDGATAARELKALSGFSSIPIIAVTASTSAREQRDMGSLFDGFINKPVSLVRLFSEAGKFLKHGLEAQPVVNEELKLPPEAFEQLSEPWKLVDSISRVFMDRLNELEGGIAVDEALKFSEALKQLSVKHSFNHLTLEVEKLKMCIEKFDLPGVDKCHNRIRQIFKQLLMVYSRHKAE